MRLINRDSSASPPDRPNCLESSAEIYSVRRSHGTFGLTIASVSLLDFLVVGAVRSNSSSAGSWSTCCGAPIMALKRSSMYPDLRGSQP